ncbi:MAG: B3/B4 domain-containing protein [Vicinamibacterales bacterium]
MSDAVNGRARAGAFQPAIAPEIWRLRPDFVALSLVVRGARNAPSAPADRVARDGPNAASEAIDRVVHGSPRSAGAATDHVVHGSPRAAGAATGHVVHGARNAVSDAVDRAGLDSMRPPWAEAHFAAWREAYRAFGAKPQRTPCSAEALWRRVARGGALAPLTAIVDLYNAVSLRYAVPVGGEDLAAYAGSPRLVRASGGEAFETVKDGQPVVDRVEPGEVIWRDDLGVTCRRWNWRQTTRTRVEVATRDLWFVLERLDPMPMAALVEAGDALIEGLRRLAPNAAVRAEIQ